MYYLQKTVYNSYHICIGIELTTLVYDLPANFILENMYLTNKTVCAKQLISLKIQKSWKKEEDVQGQSYEIKTW